MWWLLFIAVVAFVIWAISSNGAKEARRKAEEEEEARNRAIEMAREEALRLANEARARKEKQRQEEAERLSKIVTSTTNMVLGRRVITQIRVISITDAESSSEAERQFLLAVEAAGGNGAVNMRVRPHRGGQYSAQGDAVRLA